MVFFLVLFDVLKQSFVNLIGSYRSSHCAELFERFNLCLEIEVEPDVLLDGDSRVHCNALGSNNKLRHLVLVDVLNDALGKILRIDGIILVSWHRKEFVPVNFFEELTT
jgi:hypothetical protein